MAPRLSIFVRILTAIFATLKQRGQWPHRLVIMMFTHVKQINESQRMVQDGHLKSASVLSDIESNFHFDCPLLVKKSFPLLVPFNRRRTGHSHFSKNIPVSADGTITGFCSHTPTMAFSIAGGCRRPVFSPTNKYSRASSILRRLPCAQHAKTPVITTRVTHGLHSESHTASINNVNIASSHLSDFSGLRYERKPYWQSIGRWRDLDEKDFLNYEWQVRQTYSARSRDFAMLNFRERTGP